MKIITWRAIVFASLMLALTGLFGVMVYSSSVQAAFPRVLPFSARLKSTSTETAVPDGNYQVTFKIYTSETGGSAVWNETQTVSVTNGSVSANLGEITPIPTSLTFNDGSYYLGITVGSDAEMVPRRSITAVPLALNAASVDGLVPGTGANAILKLDSSGGIDIAGPIVTASQIQGSDATISGALAAGSLAVTGAASIGGNLTIAGNLVPSVAGSFDLGTSSNPFNSAYINNLVVGTTSTSGTSNSSFTINQLATGDEDSALNFYRGGSLPSAQVLWNAANGRFELNQAVAISGGLTVTGALQAASSTLALADSATNTVSTIQTIQHQTSGTVAAGFGTRTTYQLGNSNTNAAYMDVKWTALSPSMSNIVFSTNVNGSMYEALKIGDFARTEVSSLVVQGNSGTQLSTSGKHIYLDTTGIGLGSGKTINFSSGDAFGTKDVGLVRSAAGVLKVTDGSSGQGTVNALGLTVRSWRGIDGDAFGNIYVAGDANGLWLGPSGRLRMNQPGDVAIGGSGWATERLEVYNRAATQIGLVVQGYASQSVNLQEWRDSGGNPLAAITASGSLLVPAGMTAAPAITGGGGSGFRFNASGGDVGIIAGGTALMRLHSTGGIAINRILGFASNSTDLYGASPDVGLARIAAGQLKVTDAVGGNAGLVSSAVYGDSVANGTLTLQGNTATSGNTATNAAIQFKTGDSGATTAMTILNNGNVGIGASSPGEKLAVSGGNVRIDTGNLIISNASSTWTLNTYDGGGIRNLAFKDGASTFVEFNGIQSSVAPGSDDTVNLGIASRRFKSLTIGTGASSFAGNLGIGTVTPNASLTLGNAKNQNIVVENSANTTVGRALTIAAGSATNYALGTTFTATGQTSRNWYDVEVAPNGDVYAIVGVSGDVYKQAGGSGSFVSLGQPGDWRSLAVASNGDVYVAAYNGDIYKQAGGSGSFVALNQTTRLWHGMASDTQGNVYAVAWGSGLYKQTGGTGDFVFVAGSNTSWDGLAVAPNGDIYASVYNGDIYKMASGTTSLVALGQTARAWRGMAVAPNGNVYVAAPSVDIYVQIGGVGDFVPSGQTARSWTGLAAFPNGNMVATVSGGDIYKQTQSTGTANLDGGRLVLQAGVGKGTGSSIISFLTGNPLSSGTDMQAASEKMTILGNGNVGIGTTSPGSRLVVQSNVTDGTIAQFLTSTIQGGSIEVRGGGSKGGFIGNTSLVENGNNNFVIRVQDGGVSRAAISLQNYVGAGQIGAQNISFYTNNDFNDYLYFSKSSNTPVIATVGTDGSGHLALMPQGSVGIGTADPNAKLEVRSATSPQVRVAYDGSNYASLSISSSGNLSIGSTGGSVSVNGSGVNVILGGGYPTYQLNSRIMAQEVTTTALAVGAGYASVFIQPSSSAGSITFGDAGGTYTWGKFTGGNLGIGTTGPDRKLDILDASNPQMRLTYTDGTVYTDFLTNSSGDLTITPSGGDVTLAGNLAVSGTGTHTFAGTLQVANQTVTGTLTVATITSSAAISISAANNQNITLTVSGTGKVQLGSSTNNTSFDANGTMTFSGAARPYGEITLIPQDAMFPGANGCTLSSDTTGADGSNPIVYKTVSCDATDKDAFWQFAVPQNYVNGSNVQVDISWLADATSGAAAFDVGYVGVPDSGNFDGAALNNAAGSSKTTAGTAKYINTSTVTLTSPTLNAGDIANLRIRNTTNTLGVDAQILKVKVKYLVGS